MKKWIFSAAFLIALGGYAAAQNSSTVTAPKTEEKAIRKNAVKKPVAIKKTTVKKEPAVKPTKLPVALSPVDTVGVPKGKDEQ